MKNYNILVNIDKSIKCDEEIHINFLENKITTLTFQIPDELAGFSNLCILETPNRTKKTIPIENNILIISNNISYTSGEYNLIFYSFKDDIVFVSDKLSFNVNKNYLNNTEDDKIDENVELLYTKIEETLRKLNDTGLDEISDLLTEINEIKEKVDNTEVLNKLNTTQNMLQSLITMTNGMISQVLGGTNLLPDMKKTLIENNTNIKDLQKKIGNNTDKSDGTLFHHCYWAMIRAEQAHADTQKILAALNVTPTTIEEIENSKKY